MSISPEEAKRLAAELLTDSEPVETWASGPIGVGSKFGQYTIESLIATGGMGAVYRATHPHPKRVVALKVVRPDVLSRSAIRRFRLETEVLARLQHPGIAQIFEAGSVLTDLGDQPYFAMEFVEGQPLLEYADDADLSTRDRLRLFLKVCDAVEHAHQKGVIHRDLKPDNVLVTKDGEPKILDFGVAKATDADIQSTTLHTDVGQLVGTLPYMSPEQARGDAADLDTRSDVYSLGVLLYHLLSGQLPYEIKKNAVPEALRAIQEQDPAPLSSIDKTLRGDVETIVLKALEKDRERRYQGASDLAGDIRRYLANETITARPASAWYQISRFGARNKGLVRAGVVAIVLLVASSLLTLSFAVSQSRALAAAQKQVQRTGEILKFIELALEERSGDPALAGEWRVRELLDHAAEMLEELTPEDPEVEASIRATLGKGYEVLGEDGIAIAHSRRAVSLFEALHGPRDLRTLQAKRLLIQNLMALGEMGEMGELMEELAVDYEQGFGLRNEGTLTAMHGLAIHSIVSGNTERGIAILERVLEIQRSADGEELGELTVTLDYLAMSYQMAERFEDALDIYEQLLPQVVQRFGETHRETFNTLTGQAALLYRLEHTARADVAFARAERIGAELFGPDHIRMVGLKASKATRLLSLGDLVQAEQLRREVFEWHDQYTPEGSMPWSAAASALAKVLSRNNKHAEALELANRALESELRTNGDGTRFALVTRAVLARVMLKAGDQTSALAMYEEAMKMANEALSPQDPYVMDMREGYGEALLEMGRFEEAYAQLLTSYERRRNKLGPNHKQTKELATLLAEAMEATGRTDEAKALRADQP